MIAPAFLEDVDESLFGAAMNADQLARVNTALGLEGARAKGPDYRPPCPLCRSRTTLAELGFTCPCGGSLNFNLKAS